MKHYRCCKPALSHFREGGGSKNWSWSVWPETHFVCNFWNMMKFLKSQNFCTWSQTSKAANVHTETTVSGQVAPFLRDSAGFISYNVLQHVYWCVSCNSVSKQMSLNNGHTETLNRHAASCGFYNETLHWNLSCIFDSSEKNSRCEAANVVSDDPSSCSVYHTGCREICSDILHFRSPLDSHFFPSCTSTQ